MNNIDHPVAFSITLDANYLEPCLVTALDLVRHGYEDVNIVYLNRNLADDDTARKLLKQFRKSVDNKVDIVYHEVDIKPFGKRYYTEAIIYKVLLADILSEKQYALNLDCGILLGKKFHVFYENVVRLIETHRQFVFGAFALEEADHNFFVAEELRNYPHLSRYPIAAILLVNVEAYKTTRMKHRILDFYNQHFNYLNAAEQEMLYLLLKDNQFIELPNWTDAAGWILTEEPVSDQDLAKLSPPALNIPIGHLSLESLLEPYFGFKYVGPIKPWYDQTTAIEKKFYIEKRRELEKIVDLEGNELIQKNRKGIRL